MASSWERVKVGTEEMRVFVSRPEGAGPFPAVVVAQHRDGVDEFVQEMAKRLASEGYLAAAPEFYHRDGPDCRDDGPTRATRLVDSNVIEDINATVSYLKGRPDVRLEKLGVVGFCQGGRVAYLAVGVNPDLKACVSYYPGGLFAARGEGPSPFERTAKIQCPVLGHFGEEDENPSPEHMRKLDSEMKRLGKDHEFHAYPNAGHAFMNFTAPSYRPEAEKSSWPRTLSFLKRYI